MKIIFLGFLAILGLHLPGSALADGADFDVLPATGTTIRSPSHGLAFNLPSGAAWQQIDGLVITVNLPRLSGRDPDGNSEATVTLSIQDDTLDDNDDFEMAFAQLPIRPPRVDGTQVRWGVSSARYPGWLEMNAQLRLGERQIRIFTGYFSQADQASIERAVLTTIASLRFLPVTRRFAHPDGYSIEPPNGWLPRAWHADNDIRLRYTEDKIQDGWLYVYAADSWVPSLNVDSAVINIRDNFAKKMKITYGPILREKIPGGEIAWVEAPGTANPYLGAARQGGRITWLASERRAPTPEQGRYLSGEAELREGFLYTLRSVRGKE